MSKRYLPTAERGTAIIDAACALIEERGIAAVTYTAIAQRANVTRQWMYEFFPDVESILIAIYSRWERQFMNDALVSCEEYVSHEQHLKSVAESWLTMPVASAMVGVYALYCNTDDDSTAARVHRQLVQNLEVGWTQTLVAAGMDVEHARAAVMGVNATAYAQRVAIHSGLVTTDAARWYLHAVIDGLTSVVASDAERGTR